MGAPYFLSRLRIIIILYYVVRLSVYSLLYRFEQCLKVST